MFLFTSVPFAPQIPWEQHRTVLLHAAHAVDLHHSWKHLTLKVGSLQICPTFSLQQHITFVILVVNKNPKKQKQKKALAICFRKRQYTFNAIFYTMIFEKLICNKGHESFCSWDVQKHKRSMENCLLTIAFYVILLMWQIISMSFLILNYLCTYLAWTRCITFFILCWR